MNQVHSSRQDSLLCVEYLSCPQASPIAPFHLPGLQDPTDLKDNTASPTIPSCPNHCGLSFSTGSYGSTLRRVPGRIPCLPNSARRVSQSSSPSSTPSLLAATYLERSSTTGNGVSSFPFYLQSHVFLSFSPLLLVTGGMALKQVSDA